MKTRFVLKTMKMELMLIINDNLFHLDINAKYQNFTKFNYLPHYNLSNV